MLDLLIFNTVVLWLFCVFRKPFFSLEMCLVHKILRCNALMNQSSKTLYFNSGKISFFIQSYYKCHPALIYFSSFCKFFSLDACLECVCVFTAICKYLMLVWLLMGHNSEEKDFWRLSLYEVLIIMIKPSFS